LVFLTTTASAQNTIVEDIRIHGNRRIPAETIRSRMFTRAGDVLDGQSIERDFSSLWNTGYFDDLRIEREDTPKGVILHVYVTEKPTIRELKYQGLNSVSQSDVIDRYKKAKVGLTVESQYDPTKIKRAEVALKTMLAEHGRQFATIRTEVRRIPPAAVSVTFVIKEGPKVKVGNIKFEGNKKLSTRELRSAMKNLHPIGVPHSIFLENIFSKTYDASKLEEDAERVRARYQDKGFFKALVGEPKTQIRDKSGNPLLLGKGSGKRIDILIPVEEGDKYKLGSIKFENNKAIQNTKALRSVFPIRDGATFNRSLIAKGLENMRKAYGELGYVNFSTVPQTDINDEKKEINITVDVDEGKQFNVRRIEFQGNTTTRDKVIRRELALEEGGIYNSRLWELSILRLNQLGYFDKLSPEQDSEVKQNNAEATVDLLLKLKEKGKNSIGLTGGVSGLAGSFIGLNYETNNFLGLGETLTLQANVGELQRNFLFGFTEPYLFDRPLNFGFTLFDSKLDYNAARNLEIASNTQLNLPQNVLDTLQNYSTDRKGFTLSSSYPLKRSFKRVGLTYSFDISSIRTFNTGTAQFFDALNFTSFAGPNQLQGIVTSKLIPSFTFNTINNPYRPDSGKSLFVGGEVAGVAGDVKLFRPIVEYKQFIPVRRDEAGRPKGIIGYRLQGSFLTGYAGKVAPPFERFFIGGDTDLRGFDIRTVTPYAYLPTRVDFPLLNPDGTPVPKDPANPRQGNITVPLPVQTITFAGGDTSMISNVEYRIPIAGPVTLAAFNDFGLNFIARPSQLQLNPAAFNQINATGFGCPTLNPDFTCAGNANVALTRDLKTVPGSNFTPRMSTGLELQVILPIVNAPFRIYYAYNPLILNTRAPNLSSITRGMFPSGSAGDFSFAQAQAQFGSDIILKEPRKTFRFTVSTTF
jgi:outer membrane protein insertion porin family